MGWIIDGLAEALVTIIGGLINFLLSCFTSLEIDIGYSNGTAIGSFFNIGYYNTEVRGILDSVFPEAVSFFPIFTYMGYLLVLIATLKNITSTMFGPLSGNEQSPALTMGKCILGIIGVHYSYTIFIFMEMVANAIYGMFKELFNAMTGEGLPDLGDYLLNPNAFIATWDGSKLVFFVVEIGFFVVLLIQFLKLMLEAVERYIVLAVLFYTSPLAFSTISFGTGRGSDIFKSWIQMVLTALLVLMLNLFFLGMFHAGFNHIFSPQETGIEQILGTAMNIASQTTGVINGAATTGASSTAIFSSTADFVLKMCLLIGWLTVGQMVDEMLKTLGFSTAQTGHGLGNAVIAGIGATVMAAKTMMGVGKDIGAASEKMRSAKEKNAENDVLRESAQSTCQTSNDAHDTVRSNSTSSELADSLAGTKAAMTADVIGSDGQRPVFGDDETRKTLDSLGVNAPSYGEATMTDGKASFIDSQGDCSYEVGEASRWQVPEGVASFTEQGGDGSSFVHAATSEEINDASSQMVSELSAKSTMKDAASWQEIKDEAGNSTGLAIGYDDNGAAKYAASLDGVCDVDSAYGGIYTATDTQGNQKRMQNIGIEGSNGASYSVHDLQDEAHQTKHFANEESFSQNGVKFNAPAQNPTLQRKSVGEQDAYSFTHSDNKPQWKASELAKEKNIWQAKRTLAKTDPKYESRTQKRARRIENRKEKKAERKERKK